MANVWDRATEFLSDNLPAVLPIALLAIFVPSTLQSGLQPLAQVGGGAMFALRLLSLVLSIVSLWGQLAIMALALDPAAGRGPASARATRRLLPTIGIAVLAFVAVIVLALPIPVVLGMNGYDFQAAMRGGHPNVPIGNALGFTVLYTLVLIGVVLWLVARLALLNPVILGERRGLGAIGRSFALTRGLALKILGVVILFTIVATVAQLAAKTVFGSIFQLLAGGSGPVTVATMLTSVLVASVTTVFTVIASAFVAKLYMAARDTREAIARPI